MKDKADKQIEELLTKLARETTLADKAADLASTADGVKDAQKRYQWSIGEALTDIKSLIEEKERKARIDELTEMLEGFEAGVKNQPQGFKDIMEPILKVISNRIKELKGGSNE